jgi:hypothetical protein
MPDVLVALMLTLVVTIGWIGVIRLQRSVHHTSLTAAAVWAIWFQVTLTVTVIVTLAKNRVQPGILDQLWYLTAVSALCPFVAVLGARRGRLLEWSLFIVLPLIVVLEWPALAQFRSCLAGQRLELETPALLGYGFLLLMSVAAANGAERSALAMSFWFCSWLAAAGSRWTSLSLSQSERDLIVELVPLGLIAFWIAALWAAYQPIRHSSWERVWHDFQKFFGCLWAARVALRLNDIAHREQWPWCFTLQGLQPQPGSPAAPAPSNDDPRVDHAFRWLMKPFVDPEWIDERLHGAPHASDERG